MKTLPMGTCLALLALITCAGCASETVCESDKQREGDPALLGLQSVP